MTLLCPSSQAYTLGAIPDTVSGADVSCAAASSVPDALFLLAVIKRGELPRLRYGDMRGHERVGSNVFDILVCLGLPLVHNRPPSSTRQD
uniref:Uncharacterized protein n=1 Tax=Heliothis virescens TaxID=7102 RepID=A0A2A4J0F5_HELVI